ncbi:MAG: DNA translocase FtsK, partial [Bacteroidales bacterium]|nr:DNA translocase FtsK [Bacteroidales bacterium]
DKLIGRGDMLLYSGVEMERIQCALIGNDEIAALTDSIGSQVGFQKSYNTPYYLPEPPKEEGEGGGEGGMVDMRALDERFEEAARMVVQNQRGSTSDLQRRLGMGYAKAGRVMDQLEAAGIVGPQNGAKPREVLVKDFAELDSILAHFMEKE